ncbi:hypothetical protein [Nocardioides soli]|uniref:Uncharacterized protein n=1 Tax=Nocardioides soli TaxID=1036020 RepID=A0A7W4VTL9_9ACTN|nr:hypothetical protein [Nocardioides soli]MBB3041144.1 hypothetical protein [Nocardioides soli]
MPRLSADAMTSCAVDGWHTQAFSARDHVGGRPFSSMICSRVP